MVVVCAGGAGWGSADDSGGVECAFEGWDGLASTHNNDFGGHYDSVLCARVGERHHTARFGAGVSIGAKMGVGRRDLRGVLFSGFAHCVAEARGGGCVLSRHRRSNDYCGDPGFNWRF